MKALIIKQYQNIKKRYDLPTPQKIKHWADVWATFWISLSATGIVESYRGFALVCLILGYAGKALSNLCV